MSLQSQMRYMNPYDIHKVLINDYILRRPGDTKHLQRDTSKDKRDADVLREHHKFLWEDTERQLTWEEQFAKRYYDKLFKEYCIGDLSLYKENKIAMRWRTEQEVVTGKGQFTCGNKRCGCDHNLRTWEVNFAYLEDEVKKNALVKIRLCPDCSKKLNYHSKKKEVKRLKVRVKNKRSMSESSDKIVEVKGVEEAHCSSSQVDVGEIEESPWENTKTEEFKSRDDEMEEYLQDLLL